MNSYLKYAIPKSHSMTSENYSECHKITRPIPFQINYLCFTVIRKKSDYTLILSEANPVFIMSAQKRKWNISSNYLISLLPNNIDKTAPCVIGKLRSNFLGSQFHLYDNGLNPSDKKTTISNVRKEEAVILYVISYAGKRFVWQGA
jgi:Tub family